jgi:hypothetical protein
MRVNKKILLLLLAIIYTTMMPVAALAQSANDQGISLQISPLPIELSAKPGKSITHQLSVRNAGKHDEQLQVRLLRVNADNEGVVRLSKPLPSDTWANWVHFSQDIFTVPAGQWHNLNMTIDLPGSAAYGYYFAVEYLRANGEGPQPGKAVARGAVANFVLLNADAPGAIREAKIDTFIADHKSYEFLPASFQVKIHSSGNVHVQPHGNIFIMKGSKQVSSIAVNANGGNVLPDSSRIFTSTWDDGFPVYEYKMNGAEPTVNKKGQPVRHLKWDLSHANRMRMGKYTAHLVMVYDNGQRDVPLEGFVSFWIIPWTLIFLILIVIIGPALLVYTYMRRRFNKRLARALAKDKVAGRKKERS